MDHRPDQFRLNIRTFIVLAVFCSFTLGVWAQVPVVVENHSGEVLKLTLGNKQAKEILPFQRLQLIINLQENPPGAPWLVEGTHGASLLPVPLQGGFSWRVVLDQGRHGPLVKALDRGCPLLQPESELLPGQRPWREQDYREYSWQQFQELPMVRSPMDLENLDLNLLASALFYETVRVRHVANKSLKPLSFSAALQLAARLHSEQMVFYGFFDHENSYDRRWYDMTDRLTFFGVTGGFRGENIADNFALEYAGGTLILIPGPDSNAFRHPGSEEPLGVHSYFSYARQVLKELMDSPPHRANILHPDFTYLGTAGVLYRDRNFHGMPRFKVTQTFGSRVPDDCWSEEPPGNEKTGHTLENDKGAAQ